MDLSDDIIGGASGTRSNADPSTDPVSRAWCEQALQDHYWTNEYKVKQRVYSESAGPSGFASPVVSSDQALQILHATTDSKKRAQQEFDVNADVKALYFVIEAIVHALLRQLPSKVLAADLARKGFANQRVLAAFEFIRKRIDPAVIYANLAVSPEVFGDHDCTAMSAAIRKYSIPLIMGSERCQDRTCYEKCSKTCMRSSVRVVLPPNSISESDRRLAIDGLRSRRRISAFEADECKKLEATTYLAGLRTAARLSKRTGSDRAALSPRPSEPHHNALADSIASYQGLQQSVTWAREQLTKGVMASAVRTELSTKGAAQDVETVLRYAIYGLESIRAAALDDCMSSSYHVGNNCILIKAEKCEECKSADEYSCKRLRLAFGAPFSRADIESTDEPSETREIKSLFANCQMQVEINPAKAKPLLDISYDNPGEQMPVNYVARRPDAQDDFPGMFTGSEMVVDVDPKPLFDSLGVMDLGACGGMVIDM